MLVMIYIQLFFRFFVINYNKVILYRKRYPNEIIEG